jgi:hypothetical protein
VSDAGVCVVRLELRVEGEAALVLIFITGFENILAAR